jgi:hypothetical protein
MTKSKKSGFFSVVHRTTRIDYGPKTIDELEDYDHPSLSGRYRIKELTVKEYEQKYGPLPDQPERSSRKPTTKEKTPKSENKESK